MANFLALNINTLLNVLTDETLVLPRFFADIAISLIAYLFMAFGIYTMAKRQNLKKTWLAFIPYFNFILLGKVLGMAIVWGKPIKNVGLWVAITGLISALFNAVLNYGYYLYVFEQLFSVTVYFKTDSFLYLLASGKGAFYTILNYVSFIPDIAYIFFYVSIVFMVFRTYAPERALLYSLASVFIDPFFGILLFMVRNKRRYSREDFMRDRAQTYNPYSNPFGGYNNNSTQNTQNTQKNVEDPFPEFSNDNKNENKSDDYFS